MFTQIKKSKHDAVPKHTWNRRYVAKLSLYSKKFETEISLLAWCEYL